MWKRKKRRIQRTVILLRLAVARRRNSREPKMRSISPSSTPPSPTSPLPAFHGKALLSFPVFSNFPLKIGGCSSILRKERLEAVERESEFEVDRDKALAALEQLDQQLKSLSERESVPARKRPSSSSSSPYSDLDLGRRERMGSGGEDYMEISESLLANAAVALIVLTIVNNIIFGVFIKPFVDGDDLPPVAESERRDVSKVRVLPEPLTSEQSP